MDCKLQARPSSFSSSLFPQQYHQSLCSLMRDLAGNQWKTQLLWQQFQVTRLMYSCFCSVSAKLHYGSTLLRDWKEKPKPREREGIVWQSCLTKQFDFASHKPVQTLAESLLFSWDVTSSQQSVRLRVSGWQRGSWGHDKSMEGK